MIYLNSEDLKLLKNIIQKYPYKFYAYGSRVKGTHKKFSDLDLCIIEDVDYTKIVDLREELGNSDLAIKVDIKRWNDDMNEDFRKLILNDLILLKI